MTFQKMFGKKKNVVIGAIHFPPLVGYKHFPGFSVALKNALADLRALERGGVDAVIFENNYDLPHTTTVGAEIVSMMTLLGSHLKKRTHLPLGVSVLWNDYRAALSIAKTINLQFIRVPVFVDTVRTDYGVIKGEPKEVIAFRKFIDASSVAIFADIHVKHATLLSKYSLTESARRAIKNGADALIVTGKWTGDAPESTNVELVRKAIGDFPLLLGSGVDATNIRTLFTHASGAIVSTSLKKGNPHRHEINVKPYSMRIYVRKVKRMMRSLQIAAR